MTYKTNFSDKQMQNIREYRKGLVQKTLEVPKHGAIVEHTGRPGNFYFVLPTVFQPNEGCIPLLGNYKLPRKKRSILGHFGMIFDFGTGSGVIAIDAAKKGYLSVAYDINANARKSAKINSMIHNSELNQIEVIEHLHEAEYNNFYDVITGNLPFTDELSSNIAQRAAYDHNLRSHEEFFNFSSDCLKKNGRIYLAQADFGAVDEALQIGSDCGFSHKLIGQKESVWNTVPVKFYAFELRRKK